MRFSLAHGRGTRRRVLLALGFVCAAIIGATPAAASATVGVRTLSVFQWGDDPQMTQLNEPLFFYETAPATSWSSTVYFSTPTTDDVATTSITVNGVSLNSDGSLTATLVFKVNASGTSSSAVTGAACNTTTTFSQCYTGITIPAGTQFDQLVFTRGSQASNGNYWWNAGLIDGSGTQTTVGQIQVPGGTTFIDADGTVLDNTISTGWSSCSVEPQSEVQWWSPRTPSNDYAQYDGSTSSVGSSACGVTFTPLSLGPQTGVDVLAPK
jgi:hypothetical protein